MKEMSSCFFEAAIVAVDDNPQLLNMIKLNLNRRLPNYTFRDPIEALEFLKTQKLPNFVDRCIQRTEEDEADARRIDINITEIHKEIYDPARFHNVSVVVVDYAMPGMNGVEFCRHLAGSPYKIILLTGEAGLNTAVDLFNEGIIHRYLHKGDPHYIDLLTDTIFELQHAYFNDLSRVIIESITRKSEVFSELPSCLEDPVFIQFFYEFFTKHELTEYYLMDESGSFLFVDKNGRTSFLAVKTAGDMEAADDEANWDQTDMSPAARSGILDRSCLVHFFDHHAEMKSAKDWDAVIYPAQKLEGKHATYYYSYITEPLQTPPWDEKKIASFEAFLRNQ